MADLPIVTTHVDHPRHAFEVTVTLTANEWVLLTSGIQELASQEGIDELGPPLLTLAKHIDELVVQQGLDNIRKEFRDGNLRGEH